MAVPWPWIFLWVHCPSSFSHMLQQSLHGLPPAEANLPMLTLYHQCNGPILVMWRRKTGQVSGYHPMTYGGGVQGTLWNHSKDSLLPLPCKCKLVLWLSGQGYTEKRHLLSPAQHSTLLGLWARYIYSGKCGHSHMDEEGLPCSVLSSVLSSTMSDLNFYQPFSAVLDCLSLCSPGNLH